MQTTQNIIIKRLLALTAERQASDLLLVVGNKPVLRIGGQLIQLEEEDVMTQDFIQGVIDNILTKEQNEQLLVDRELIFTYDFVDQNRFRIDINFQRDLMTINFHYLSSIVKKVSDIGFPKEVEQLTTNTHGLVFVSGQQGSGRTTTLAGIIETINHREVKHILSLEKPIEYSLISYKSVIEQQEVGHDVKGWLDALEIEEQGIDVLVLSKITNGEVLKKVITLAHNGVMIYAAHDATTTEFLFHSLLNMIDLAERSFYAKLLSEVYKGSIIQKLLPRIGGGQVLAIELALSTGPLAGVIREQKFEQIPNLIQTARSEGMITMDRYLMELVRSGQVDKKIALQEATNPQSLDSGLKI